MGVMGKVDQAQKAHRSTSIAAATYKKFSDDQSTSLAAMIAFWAFFSIFPLLLVLITILGWVLPSSDKASVLGHIAKLLPLINTQKLAGLSGSVLALLVGLLTSLWSGIGAVRTVQTAFNAVWEIPYHKRPGMLEQVGRSVVALALIGGGLVVATFVSSLAAGTASGLDLGVLGHVLGFVIAAILDVALFIIAFRVLTDQDLSTRDVLPGAILSGVVFFVLQELSSFIISDHLKSANATYGTFGIVITILWWFYLQSVITLLGAQLNVVLRERLYPRSLSGGPQTDADHRALRAYARERTYHEEQRIRVDIEKRPAE